MLFRIFLIGTLVLGIAYCYSANRKKKEGIHLEIVEVAGSPIQKSAEKGYGYRIYVNDTLLIYQPFIPNVLGRHPFKTKNDAKKVGNLVVHHMRACGNFFVSRKEIDSLDIDVN